MPSYNFHVGIEWASNNVRRWQKREKNTYLIKYEASCTLWYVLLEKDNNITRIKETTKDYKIHGITT
jgi:hypothetical protein